MRPPVGHDGVPDCRLMNTHGLYPRRVHIRPGGPVEGKAVLPGSKSLTNRALVCAALADGTSTLTGALRAEDTLVMMNGLVQLGAEIEASGTTVTVVGTAGDLRAPSGVIDAGASGTTARFLTAAATLADGTTVVDGTVRMRSRPIEEQVMALRILGAEIEILGEAGCPPVRVTGGELRGGAAVIDARRSSQFVSAVALVAPYASQPTELGFRDGLLVSRPYVEATVEVMKAFGVVAELTEGGMRIPTGVYEPVRYQVEPDASAAAYPLVAAAITGGSVQIEGIPADSTQADLGILDVLAAMGCHIERRGSMVSLTGPAEGLRGVDVDMGAMPDAAVAVAVAAVFAAGPTRLSNIANLRIKETDRLAALETELRKLGARAEAGSDWLLVTPSSVYGAEIATYNDHRMAMAFALAGLVVPGVVIADPACVGKTWPSFFGDLDHLRPIGGTVTRRSAEEDVPSRSIIVAIDGPGGAGKSTVSRGVAARLNIPHLDSGASYRAAALAVVRRNVNPEDAGAVASVVRDSRFGYRNGTMLLDGEEVGDALRSAEMTSLASRVSAIPEVREVLVGWQRDWVRQEGGSAVIEGRDIGTVVFPDAPVKVFLTARPDVRAARRAAEMTDERRSVAGVARELEERDQRDSTRNASPLQAAADALVLDTSDLGIEQVIDRILAVVAERRGS
jgi:3-phosphoshikimate 1-carboxyvinyltransferase